MYLTSALMVGQEDNILLLVWQPVTMPYDLQVFSEKKELDSDRWY